MFFVGSILMYPWFHYFHTSCYFPPPATVPGNCTSKHTSSKSTTFLPCPMLHFDAFFSPTSNSFNLKKLNLSIFPSRHFPFPQYLFFLINVAFLAQPHKLLVTTDFDFPQELWSNQVTSHITLLDTNSSSSSSSYNPGFPTKKAVPTQPPGQHYHYLGNTHHNYYHENPQSRLHWIL